MPAMLTPALPVIAFSKNTLMLKIQSDDYLAAVPAKAVNYIEFIGPIAPEYEFIIAWTGGAGEMTAKAVPDDSGTQFPSGDGGSVYVAALVDWFQGNFFIDQAYVVSADVSGPHPRLIFTARLYGANFTFTDTAAPYGVTTPGADNRSAQNFAHHIELWLKTSDNSPDQLAYTANVPLDEPQTGVTTIDIHDSLHSLLSSDTPVLLTAYEQCKKSIRQYYPKYAQYLGEPAAVQRVKTGANCWVNKGGLGMRAALVRNISTELSPSAGHPEQNRFMRQGSINKPVTKEQPEWLTWINLTNGTVNVSLEVIIYNEDGTTFTFSPFAAFDINAYEKYQFQTGFTQLAIQERQDIAIVPVYYTVRLKQGDNYLSAAYAYVIDYNFREFPRYFVYENSYGAFQTLATIGRGQAEADRNKTDVQLTADRATAAAIGEFIEANITFQDKFTVAIGYQRSTDRIIRLLRDLLASRTKYIWDNGALIPIGLNTKNLKDTPDGINAYAVAIEYYPLYLEETFTEDISQVSDDEITALLGETGGGLIVPHPDLTSAGTIDVEFGDIHLSMVAGQQVYTAPYWLEGKENYQVWTSQESRYFLSADIEYDTVVGSFKILVPGFVLQPGDKLIIWPFILNPDS